MSRPRKSDHARYALLRAVFSASHLETSLGIMMAQCNIFKISEAGGFGARLLALLMVNNLGDFCRGKSDFNVPSGDPHRGGGGNPYGDHGDRLSVFITSECNAKVAADLFRRDGAESE